MKSPYETTTENKIIYLVKIQKSKNPTIQQFNILVQIKRTLNELEIEEGMVHRSLNETIRSLAFGAIEKAKVTV